MGDNVRMAAKGIRVRGMLLLSTLESYRYSPIDGWKSAYLYLCFFVPRASSLMRAAPILQPHSSMRRRILWFCHRNSPRGSSCSKGVEVRES